MTALAFVQPFGIHSKGGGPRILRALLDGTDDYLSICSLPQAPERLAENEVHLPVRPYFGRIESTRFSPPFYLLEYFLDRSFQRRLKTLLQEHDVQAVHAIPHGLEFWYAFEVARDLGLPYVLNVHDHLTYNIPGYPWMDWVLDRLQEVWQNADQRFVISDVMGESYCQMYGDAPFDVVTDGLTSVAPAPRSRAPSATDVYFMGALHLTYQPNFDALLTSLDHLKTHVPEQSVSMTSRGSTIEPTWDVPIRNLPWAPEAEVEKDLDDVNWLYFPLPFDEAHDDFVRYSLSTKLVTYLGSGLPILYHGPAHAAAARLLDQYDAAVQVHTLEPEALVDTLIHPPDLDTVVENALELARDQFRLEDQRRRFWSNISALIPLSDDLYPTTQNAALHP